MGGAQVDQSGGPVGVDHHVAGLQVSVKQPLAVQVGHRLGEPGAELGALGQAALGAPGGQGAALDVLGCKPVSLGIGVDHSDHVAVVEGLQSSDLPAKPRSLGTIFGDLERHLVALVVQGQPDASARAHTE